MNNPSSVPPTYNLPQDDESSYSKILLAFDFDNTITEENTCTTAIKLVSKCVEVKKAKNEEWNDYMNRVFSLYESCAVTPYHLKEALERVPLVAGMLELFNYIDKNKYLYDCVMISNANSFFIYTILNHYGLKPAFNKIYTNRAIQQDGVIKILDCHSHNHAKCPRNLCKGSILAQHIREQKANGTPYRKICYFGDGANDFCPAFLLAKRDIVFPRYGYRLHDMLEDRGYFDKIPAHVFSWDDGFDILRALPEVENPKWLKNARGKCLSQ